MNTLLIKLWNKFVNIGIHDDLEESEKIKIKLINKLLFISYIVTIGVLVIFRIYLSVGTPLTSIGTLSLITLCLYFQYIRRFDLARHLIGFLFPTYLAYVVYAEAQNNAQLNLLLISALMIFILYEDKPKLKMISLSYVFLIGIGSNIIAIIKPYQFTYEQTYYNHISLFVSTLIVISFIIYFYQKDIFKYETANSLLFDELKSKNEELERFAYVTSHDLKEPVRNIGSFAEVLESSIGNPQSIEKNKEIINLIEVSSSRMSSLIDSILNFSKIDAQEFYSEEVSIAELIQEFITSHNQLVSARNVNISFDDLPIVNGNKIFLSLLFQNLLKNSILYNDSSQPTIAITCRKHYKSIEIIVADNGIGIDEEFYDYIFEPFKKLTSDILFQGSGLGLAISKKVVEYHGGTISVVSDKGTGSQFILNFPSN